MYGKMSCLVLFRKRWQIKDSVETVKLCWGIANPETLILVHPLRTAHGWQGSDPELARGAVASSFAPDIGVLMRVAIVGGLFDRFDHFRPDLKASALKG